MSILQLTRFYKQPVAISALSPRMRTRKAFMDGLHHVISVWSILAIALFWNAPAVSTLLVESHHSHFYIKFSFRELFLLLLIASRKPRNYLYAITIPLTMFLRFLRYLLLWKHRKHQKYVLCKFLMTEIINFELIIKAF